MKKISFLLLVLMVCKFNGVAQSKIGGNNSVAPQEVPSPTADYYYKVIECKNNTFGYNIFKNKKLFIHQITVPAMQGDTGFSSKEKAKLVAELAIKKLKQGQAMPTISKEELIELNAIK